MLAPGVPALMSDFNSSSNTLSAFVVSVYILGYVFGPIILAPLSELYGRLPLYQGSNVGFVIFTVACALANNLESLIVFRFIEGVFGSCPLTIGGGTIADMIVQEKRGGVMAIWALGPLMGPVIGPIAGGYATEALGWRWVFWIIAIVVCRSAFHHHHFSSNQGRLMVDGQRMTDVKGADNDYRLASSSSSASSPFRKPTRSSFSSGKQPAYARPPATTPIVPNSRFPIPLHSYSRSRS